MTVLSHRRAADVNLRHTLQLREYDAIADRIAADAPGRVLDWGCGFGQMSALLRDRGVDVEAFDYRPEAEESGRRPLARYPGLEAFIENADEVRLPYESRRFDAVLSCGVLEHVGDPDGSLEELKRVLRPAGRCTSISSPTAAPTWRRSRSALGSTTTAPGPTTASTTCPARASCSSVTATACARHGWRTCCR